MEAALVWSRPAYDPSTDFVTYEMAFTAYFAANGIKETAANSQNQDPQMPALRAFIGIRALDIRRSMCAPDPPTSKSYDDLLALLRQHLENA